ncbi:putative nucleotidyltransferase substrate binding domain-containing protein [Corynebacterium uterequi]|uniref:Putative nucleotidyltransferase substrate binding domain n=1 Tax=Corynebacterium uterequi TaxID=1072256 RepID=A0A0G3HBP8_9CORY|nr:putative nucleotidyltransferase substrate binding domain-containing protein [Corynebacterium uterequi]AKK10689.1 Putative nucleotidyltransferase substrate binding domain [Corynebacterium uterequi]
MPLHESLLDLGELAPRCDSLAAAKGVLAESQELLLNALAHRFDPPELVCWLSKLVRDVVRSPAVVELSGAPLQVTGAFARGDATPTTVVEWLAAPAGNREIVELLAATGWRGRSVDAPDAPALLDAGVATAFAPTSAWADVVRHRPEAMHTADGRPDDSVVIRTQTALLRPIADLARWAAGERAAAVVGTCERLSEGVARGVLTDVELEDLLRARRTGMELALLRWKAHTSDEAVAWSDMPALQRSAYGEAARTLAAVVSMVAARNEVSVDESESE